MGGTQTPTGRPSTPGKPGKPCKEPRQSRQANGSPPPQAAPPVPQGCSPFPVCSTQPGVLMGVGQEDP